MYIDDILTTSATFEEYLEHLEQVFDRMRKANLHFLCNKVKYLGHVISVH